VGRLLVSAAEDIAREHGHDQVWVVADDDDLEFYRRCGWQAGDQDPGRSAGVLAKQLASA
jgi:GNAT superfamily N-acetyltransferase